MTRIFLETKASVPKAERALVYFVCGNPGLVEYYDAFLGCVASLTSHLAYDVYGRNLLGFADEEHEPFTEANQPWDLEGQIDGVVRDVKDKGDGYKFVVLVGHSVGAYICVEALRRMRKLGEGAKEGTVDVRHGVLLFPTLEWIARSPSGRRMAMLMRVPGLKDSAHRIAAWILGFFSYAMLVWIVGSVMGFNDHCAGVTAQWLKGKGGVHQAIHLGKSEMKGICEDEWEEELWGLVKNENGSMGGEVPRFFVYYGKKDHWVDDEIRDLFIERRRKGGERGTKVEVDGGDVPHAFCVRDGE
ncbi:hypothetical protein N3K66_007857 [Trichothecium roseum]|uniref:Uncharacterized protein n=1 Tax=Trichothecium roseum TaxID=47278 RepID=A0ACC0USY8_9HYPO|nr:hypothetical protein N3K66_007857 [Trichothecium roseum]